MARGSGCPCQGWGINWVVFSPCLAHSCPRFAAFLLLSDFFFPFISNLLVQGGLSKLSYKISNFSRVPRCLQPGISAIFSAPLAQGCKPSVHPVRPYQCGAICPNIHLIPDLFRCPYLFLLFWTLHSKRADKKHVHSACSRINTIYYRFWQFLTGFIFFKKNYSVNFTNLFICKINLQFITGFGVVWGFFSTALSAHQWQVQQRIERNLRFPLLKTKGAIRAGPSHQVECFNL